MKQFLKKYFKWFILGILVFLLALIIKNLLGNSLNGFDNTIYNFIHNFNNPILTFIFKVITFLSSGPVLIVFSVFLFFLFRNKKFGIISLINLIFIVILNNVLKLFFSRPRPIEWMLIEENGYSFPSGHAMVSMAFYGMLIYLIWQTTIKLKYKKIFTIMFGLLIILVGLSRIYLGVHYPSDILAGFSLSLSYLIIITPLINYYIKK